MPYDADVVTELAYAALKAGEPHKGGTICPGCEDWTDRHTRSRHARECQPLRDLVSLASLAESRP